MGIKPKTDFWRRQDVRDGGVEKRNQREQGKTKGNIREVKVERKLLRRGAGGLPWWRSG